MGRVTVEEDRIAFEELRSFQDSDRSGRRGLDIEHWAVQQLPLEKDRSHYHDAHDHFGRQYEIKAAKVCYETGQPGTFWIRRGQKKAMAPSDMYLFVVYDVHRHIRDDGLYEVEEYRILDYTRRSKMGLSSVVSEDRYSLIRHDTLGEVEVASVPWTDFPAFDEGMLNCERKPDDTIVFG